MQDLKEKYLTRQLLRAVVSKLVDKEADRGILRQPRQLPTSECSMRPLSGSKQQAKRISANEVADENVAVMLVRFHGNIWTMTGPRPAIGQSIARLIILRELADRCCC